jgi:phosphoenolpyruvate synthase/pyruvate phosphate dikinase
MSATDITNVPKRIRDNISDGEIMDKQYVIPLNAPQADLETVGGKGMSLAKLANAGLPVPGGFHVTTEAYRQFVAANNLQAEIIEALQDVDVSQPSTLETASATIGQFFARAEIPGDLANAIVNAYAALPGSNPAVAIRSSATAEDLPDASFAGQQETYLNITGADQVLDATKKCWASLWTARAIGYRARQNIGAEGVALAVVVQVLINAEAAGIMFTANPLNGDRDQAVINAAWGLGEAIVGGAVTPDTLTVSKPNGSLIRRETAGKQVMTVRTESGTEEQPVPDSLKNVPVLSDEQAAKLAHYGSQIEELYGMPMDIEWTLADGNFSIVQARPVTAMPEAPLDWLLPDPKGVYMRTSIADLMPEALSPLFVTMGIPTLRKKMNPLAKRVIGGNPDMGPYYFTHINTYAYMNSKFPSRTWGWILFRMLPAYPGLIRGLVPLWRNELHPEYQTFVTRKQDLVLQEMSAAELWHETQELFEAAAYYMDGLMFATMGASAGSEMLLTNAYNKLAKQEGDPEATTLLMGWDNIPVRSEKSLYDIAMWVRENDELEKFILETPTAELVKKNIDLGALSALGGSKNQWDEFTSRIQTHLDTFGHVIFQLDFAEDLPRDHPEMMLETIKMYLRGEGTNPYERQQASQQKRIETAETMLNRLKGLKLWLFRTVLKWAQSLSEVREDALAEMGLAYPKMRELLRELGQRFVEASVIESAADIFWLEKDEIQTCVEKLENNQALEDLSAQVEKRKAFNKKVSQVTPPPMIPMKERVMGFKSEIFIAQTEDAQAGSVLMGVPASAGKVTAQACVLHGPEDFDQMRPGDVLVAGTTTPAWTPLFAMASAVVTDIGGPLSHGSIVAREYGIPAVMGTGVATRRIQSGQTITVDGTKGEVALETSDDEGPAIASPTEWPVPEKGATFARGSLAEHTPSPISPLFATLGLRIANHETEILWRDFVGVKDPTSMFIGNGFYMAINNYVYGGFRMNMKNTWAMIKMSFSAIGPMMRDAPERWQAAREKLAVVVNAWERKDIANLSLSELLNGACTIFGAEVKYYTVIQTTLPAASMGEIFFTRFYDSLVKRKTDPEATAFLFGFETMPVRAEMSLFDIAIWLKENPVLADYTLRTPTENLVADFEANTPPKGFPVDLWAEYLSFFEQHFEKFGRTAYEFDFTNPTPAEVPSPQFEAIKLFIEGKAESPYQRLQNAREKREQATRSVLKRIGWPRKGWFEKLLKKAHETGVIREDSIFDMGMGHPIIRRMFAELGKRFVASGAIQSADDIYWLEEDEVTKLIAALEKDQPLPNFADRIPKRKAEWRAALQIVPPVMLPEKSFWQKFIGGGKPQEQDGKTVLKGLGTSSGQVTAPACVLYGPEDFPKMKPGDVLVATTTTPAWTPLFAMASAVVTDIGGPLSHSSIVAREYGIPAVMAARNATRHIQSGQMVKVNGKEGTVVIL